MASVGLSLAESGWAQQDLATRALQLGAAKPTNIYARFLKLGDNRSFFIGKPVVKPLISGTHQSQARNITKNDERCCNLAQEIEVSKCPPNQQNPARTHTH